MKYLSCSNRGIVQRLLMISVSLCGRPQTQRPRGSCHNYPQRFHSFPIPLTNQPISHGPLEDSKVQTTASTLGLCLFQDPWAGSLYSVVSVCTSHSSMRL